MRFCTKVSRITPCYGYPLYPGFFTFDQIRGWSQPLIKCINPKQYLGRVGIPTMVRVSYGYELVD